MVVGCNLPSMDIISSQRKKRENEEIRTSDIARKTTKQGKERRTRDERDAKERERKTN